MTADWANTRDVPDKRIFVQRLFSRIARRYDWFNRLASCGLDQRWRRAAIHAGDIQPGHRVLDLCTGTGDLALLCAARQQARRLALGGGGRVGGQVVGLDMNRDMLRLAQRKPLADRAGLAWVQADAEQLPFDEAAFDRVAIGFSTRNLTDLSAGVHEMVRVLKPGGRLLILETGYPPHPLVRAGYRVFLSTIARLIGWALTGRIWPFTYLARSVRQFLTPAAFLELLRRQCAQVRYVPLSGGLASLFIAIKQDAMTDPSPSLPLEASRLR